MRSSHPVVLHQLPQVIDESELLWIHLQGGVKKQHRGLPVSGDGLRGERCNVCISLQHSCPPSWWWTFPTERWHRPQPRPGGTPSRAGRTAASAPSARLPPRHCWSSREWCPTARYEINIQMKLLRYKFKLTLFQVLWQDLPAPPALWGVFPPQWTLFLSKRSAALSLSGRSSTGLLTHI